MPAVDKSLLERVARSISQPGSGAPSGVRTSILKQAAASYGSRPILDEATVPTGFDPQAAVLFEAVVEAAFLIAACDGVFDDEERIAFESVVAEACDNIVQMPVLDALVADLREQLAEDGIEKRARNVARAIYRRDHQVEVLRIGALMAHMGGGISQPERDVLELFAKGFDLPSGAVDHAIEQAKVALGATE